ncbi:MAG: type II secretion system protein [Chthoniobacterales bacterium]|nr:type II secretion system protein [Chthoniobacterales bacterium]
MRGYSGVCKAEQSADAFTLVEVLITLTIVAILIVLSIGGLQGMAAQGRAAKCMGNLRQISLLMTDYLADHNSVYPYAAWRSTTNDNYTFWPSYLVNHSGDTNNYALFRCPGASDIPLALQTLQPHGMAYTSYGINRYGVSPSVIDMGYHPAFNTRIDEPSKLMLLLETDHDLQPWDGWYWTHYSLVGRDGAWNTVRKRHRTVNALFCDGHVSPMSRKDLLPTNGAAAAGFPWAENKYTLDQ